MKQSTTSRAGRRTRPLMVGAVVGVLALSGAPAQAERPGPPAADGSLQGLVLSGGCPGQSSELKNLVVSPRTRSLFAPLRLVDSEFTPLRKWLFPYTVQITGEGLKSRHLTPGVVYTRPGRPPREAVTCLFTGATKEDGPFEVQITGAVRGW